MKPYYLNLAVAAMLATSSVAALAAPAGASSGTPITARDDAIVEGVQMPAWVSRGGARVPVSVGMALHGSDEIVTGENARLLVRLPEGSAVRLGENADFRIQALAARNEGSGTFMKAALEVAKGAFRFTTSLADKLRSRREVDIKFASVTAGIRGTDLWGKTSPDKEVVCLIEGKIEVQRGETAPVTLSDPLTFYVAPTDQPSQPVAGVTLGQLATWALETDIANGAGAQVKGGRFQVNALETPDELAALSIYDALRAQGYPVEFVPKGSPGKRIYAVRLGSLASEDDAKAVAARMSTIPGVSAHASHA